MRNKILIFAAAILLMGSNGNLLQTEKPEEVILNPNGLCEAYYRYLTHNPENEHTTVYLECKFSEKSSIASFVLSAEGIGHQIELEWLSNEKLKVSHSPELKITDQAATGNVYYPDAEDREGYLGEIEIEFDPPYEEPPEPEMLNETNWPTDCDQAAQMLYADLDDDSKTTLAKTKKEDLIMYHFGWGTGIRNRLGLWRGNVDLLTSCIAPRGQELPHPDDVSGVIIERVWELTQK